MKRKLSGILGIIMICLYTIIFISGLTCLIIALILNSSYVAFFVEVLMVIGLIGTGAGFGGLILVGGIWLILNS